MQIMRISHRPVIEKYSLSFAILFGIADALESTNYCAVRGWVYLGVYVDKHGIEHFKPTFYISSQGLSILPYGADSYVRHTIPPNDGFRAEISIFVTDSVISVRENLDTLNNNRYCGSHIKTRNNHNRYLFKYGGITSDFGMKDYHLECSDSIQSIIDHVEKAAACLNGLVLPHVLGEHFLTHLSNL